LARSWFGPWWTDELIHLDNYSSIVASRIIRKRTDAYKILFHRDPTPFEIYVLWNAPGQISKPSKVVSERAKRFENLVEAKLREKK
jgi:hypothetical protein